MAEERASGAHQQDGAEPAPDATRAADPEAAPRLPADVDAALAALSEEERAVLAKVANIVQRIRFGTVVLVIQDGKVVQIEMAEKFRLR